MDSQDKAAATCVVIGFILVGWLATQYRGCNRDDGNMRVKQEEARAGVQIECIKAGHPALECKELR